jgi:hypothetical protein
LRAHQDLPCLSLLGYLLRLHHLIRTFLNEYARHNLVFCRLKHCLLFFRYSSLLIVNIFHGCFSGYVVRLTVVVTSLGKRQVVTSSCLAPQLSALGVRILAELRGVFAWPAPLLPCPHLIFFRQGRGRGDSWLFMSSSSPNISNLLGGSQRTCFRSGNKGRQARQLTSQGNSGQRCGGVHCRKQRQTSRSTCSKKLSYKQGRHTYSSQIRKKLVVSNFKGLTYQDEEKWEDALR